MERGGKIRGRGKPRKTVQEMMNQPDVVHSPYPFQSTGRKRGRPRVTPQERPRKTPQQTVNATNDEALHSNPSFPENSREIEKPIRRAEDAELNSSSPKELPSDGQDSSDSNDEDYSPSFPKTTGRKRGRPRKTPVNATGDDSNPFFPESSRKRGKRITQVEANELNSSSFKELFTSGPRHHVQDSCVIALPSNPMMSVMRANVNSRHHIQDSGVARNHPLPSNLVMYVADEYVNSSHHVQDSGVACNHPLPSNLVMSIAGENVNSSHHVQDSGVACNHPLPNNLVMTVTGDNVNSSHLATPIDESKNLIETEDDSCCLTKGKGVASEPASDTILQRNKVLSLLGENIAKNSVFSDSSKSECLLSERSKDVPIVPMDSRVHVVAKDARTTATCQSYNLTEAVDKINKTLHDDDGEDIQSAIDPSLVDVNGYRVKPEIAPLLNEIFKQHGDIVKDCKVKGLEVCFLEQVCSVYEKLHKSSLQEIKRGELYEMRETLKGLKKLGLNVKWLSDRVCDILDTRVFVKVYGQCRNELKNENDRLIALKNEAAQILERMSGLETKISEMKAEKEKVKKTCNLLHSSLVDGLI